MFGLSSISCHSHSSSSPLIDVPVFRLVLDAFARVILLFLLLLIGNGWMITSATAVGQVQLQRVVYGFGLLAILYIIMAFVDLFDVETRLTSVRICPTLD